LKLKLKLKTKSESTIVENTPSFVLERSIVALKCHVWRVRVFSQSDRHLKISPVVKSVKGIWLVLAERSGGRGRSGLAIGYLMNIV
jgi:hypothetical protein